MTQAQKYRTSRTYLVLRQREKQLLEEVKTAPTIEARIARYVAWQQTRQARIEAAHLDPLDSVYS